MNDVVGIGTEIVECLRIAQMIERHGELFLGRVFTPAEINYCHCRKQSTQHFASRWAAKEAVFKALGAGWRRGLGWRDVEVRTLPDGQPAIEMHSAAKELMEQRGIERIVLSISHCRTHATAYAIALGQLKSPEKT